MANLCDFTMRVNGKNKESIEKFRAALMQEDKNLWMGRGAEVTSQSCWCLSDGRVSAEFEGYVKWSIQSALIDDALSMRTQKESGTGYWGDIDDIKDFITLCEATERFNVTVEVFSKEPGCCFQEHYIIANGDFICNETAEYYEDYNEDMGEYEESGGFDYYGIFDDSIFE